MGRHNKGNYVIGIKLKRKSLLDVTRWYYFYEEKEFGPEYTSDMNSAFFFETKQDAVNWWNSNESTIMKKLEDVNYERISLRKIKDVFVIKENSSSN